jgi:hypothetical protein
MSSLENDVAWLSVVSRITGGAEIADRRCPTNGERVLSSKGRRPEIRDPDESSVAGLWRLRRGSRTAGYPP